MSMTNTPQVFCAFPGAVGFDRVLKMQSYVSNDNNKVMYSWPDPSTGSGSCNVVILGQPGTGKTTFALELAARLRIVRTCLKGTELGLHCMCPYPVTVIYYSLEQPSVSLINRVEEMQPECADCIIGPKSGLDNELQLLNRPRKGKNLLLFPQLSPRRLEQVGEQGDDTSIFWQRYNEIRYLIEQLKLKQTKNVDNYNNPEDKSDCLPPLKMVVVDSLNVFGDKPVTRYMIEQLFSLFEEENLIGVCVAEDPESAARSATGEPNVSPGIANIADIVIKLGWNEQQGYKYRNLEIVKSRNTRNVYGSQLVKIRQRGVEIYPSLHCWYSYLTDCEDCKGQKLKNRLSFVNKSEMSQSELPSVAHTITGPMDTFKTQLALWYAGQCNINEEFLLLSLDVSHDPSERAAGCGSMTPILGEDLGEEIGLSRSKGRFHRVKIGKKTGYQLWMSPGYLLAEELVHFTYEVLTNRKLVNDRKKIKRVVVLDIGQIPMRHPALAYQISEHGNFFVVLLELFRKLSVDCCFVCNDDVRTRHFEDPEHMSKMLTSISHGVLRTSKLNKDETSLNPNNKEIVRVSYSGRFVNGTYSKDLVKESDIQSIMPLDK